MAPQSFTVADELHRRSKDDGGIDFLHIGSRWRSAADIEQKSREVAGGLAALGVSKGDRVAVLLPNCSEMIDVFFACSQLGAVLVPLNAWLKGTFLSYQLADCGAGVLVADRLGLESAIPLLAESSIRQLVAVGDDPPATSVPTLAWTELANTGEPTSRPVSPGDPMAIVYTSGTTGVPKGCVLSNGYYTSSPKVIGDCGWLQPGDRLLTAWPLFHSSGQQVALMSALAIGASVVFEAEFSASTFMESAVANDATVLAGVGFMAAALLAQPPRPVDRVHSCRLSWWIPMAADQQKAFEQRFGIPVIAEAFGQTEAFPISMVNAVSPDRKPGTLGTVSDHFEVRLVDDDDNEVPVGTPGEIALRPRHPHVMFSGYWRQPEATLTAWRNLWHHTGDLARTDEHGVLRFVDRKKDAVRRRGENVSSLELEAAIRQHPAVADVAVCAIASATGEDDIRAVVVCAPDQTLDPAELFGFFKRSIPYYAIPRYVEVVEALPVNSFGRVMKHVLRAAAPGPDSWDFEDMGLVVPKGERR
jgi:carnitine-CoA ligase